MIRVLRTGDVSPLFAPSLHSLNYFHCCFRWDLSALLSSTGIITAALMPASRYPGPETKMLPYCTRHSKAQKAQQVTVCEATERAGFQGWT